MVMSLCHLWSHSLVLGPGSSCYTHLTRTSVTMERESAVGVCGSARPCYPAPCPLRCLWGTSCLVYPKSIHSLPPKPSCLLVCLVSINITLILSIESNQKPGHLYTRFPLTSFSDQSPHPVYVTVKSLSHPFSVSSLVHVTCVIARSSTFVSFQQYGSLWPVCQHLPWPISSLVLAPCCLTRYTSHCSRRRTDIFHIIWKLSANTPLCCLSAPAELTSFQSLYHDLSCTVLLSGMHFFPCLTPT